MAERLGFAFDIDGVLIRSGEPIPGARQALQSVIDAQIPYILLTNSAACTSEEKARTLSQTLDLHIPPEKVILSHSPIPFFAKDLKDKLVVIAGRPNCRDVMEQHGFTNILTTTDICNLIPDIYPYKTFPSPQLPSADVLTQRIHALFIVSDSDDWQRDLQISLDIAKCDGRLGSFSDQQVVPVFFSNPDFVYAAKYPIPRMTMGSFTLCLGTLFEHETGRKLEYVQFGKPQERHFEFAGKLLQGLGANRFIMIDDNPLSGIKGANQSDDWTSVLTLTGIAKENCGENPADFVFDDVLCAMKHFLELN
ncbi:hypothetical protein GEMRC1_004819 [Eukaryota sp. GEM-RC1]